MARAIGIALGLALGLAWAAGAAAADARIGLSSGGTAAAAPPAAGATGASTIASDAASASSAVSPPSRPGQKTGSKATGGGQTAGKKNADNKSPFAGLGLANDHGPVDIHSDSLDLDYKGGQAVFRGHVHAVQSGSSLNSEILKVVYGENFKEIKQVVAQGKVRIDQGGRWVTGERAVLNQVNHTIEMTGSPVIHDGKDQIAGSRIVIYLDSEKSVVEGARGVFFPRRSETRDNDGVEDGAMP